MDDLLENAKKAIKSMMNNEELEKQLLETRNSISEISESLTKYAGQLTFFNESISSFESELKKIQCTLEELQHKTKELVLWREKVEIAAKAVANIQQPSEQTTPFENICVKDELNMEESQAQVPNSQNEEQWPLRFYADSFSSFSPYGFSLDDLQSEYIGQLYVIDQKSATEASFTVNDQLEFSQILSNYKYGLKPVCDELQRNENPSQFVVVEPGHLQLNNDIWEIKRKILINIL